MAADLSIEIRRATSADVEGIAAVRLSNGPAHADSGANPAYCRHLIEDEHLWVALDASGDAVGFAGAVDTGGARLLSDLFVRADAHGRGVGSGLLRAVFDGADERYTFASTDPAALPLYTRAGMRTRWTLLEMSGPAMVFESARASDIEVRRVDGHAAAAAELEMTGVDRSSAHCYWAARDSATALVVTGPEGVAGIAAVAEEASGDGLRIDHLVSADHMAPVVMAAVVGEWTPERVHAYVPGSTEFAAWLLAHRFVVDDISLHMATAGAGVHPLLAVVHPGLG